MNQFFYIFSVFKLWYFDAIFCNEESCYLIVNIEIYSKKCLLYGVI